MHTIGIIAEYNPFHNGHIYQIQTIRGLYPKARILGLMSGSFTQRGSAAILDKWQRAQHAVLGGIDLVLELPTVFAVRSAQDFARGGISLLTRLGIADGLAFGAESRPSILKQAANSIDTIKVQERLHLYIQEGISYAAALSRAIAAVTGVKETLLKKPNNILALEYLRALNHRRSTISPLILERVGASYHDTELHELYASASAIRREIQAPSPSRENLRKVLPAIVLETLLHARNKDELPVQDLLLRPLLAQLEHYGAKGLQEIYGINEGLENRILHAASHCCTMDDLLSQSCTRRYAKSRIQRLIFHILLHLHQEDVLAFDSIGPLYARILAFNRKGKALLHEIKQKSSIPLISKTSHVLNDTSFKQLPEKRTSLENMLALDIHATELRRLCSPKLPLRGEDFRRSPLDLS